MKLDVGEKNRKMESQDLLRQVMSEAMGIYMAKEPSNGDSWRDNNQVTMWGLFQHLKHEIEEIDRSESKDRFYHNCLDAINLLAMLAARTRLLEK